MRANQLSGTSHLLATDTRQSDNPIRKHSFLKKDPTRSRINLLHDQKINLRQPQSRSPSVPDRDSSNIENQPFSHNTSYNTAREQVTPKNNTTKPFMVPKSSYGNLAASQSRQSIVHSSQITPSNEIEQKTNSFLSLQEFQVCPEFYMLWRCEELVGQIAGQSFKIRYYSKGRQEIMYEDGTVEVLFDEIKLTKWSNGDYKLVEGEKVSFWCEELKAIGRYYIE